MCQTIEKHKLLNGGKPFQVRLRNGLIITLADNFYAWESAKDIVAEILWEKGTEIITQPERNEGHKPLKQSE